MGNEQKYRKPVIYLLLLTVILSTALLVFGDKLYLNSSVMWWTMGVISFLFLYGLMTIFVVDRKIQTANSRQIVSLYMLLKGGKILAFLFTIVIYMFVFKVEAKRFLLVAIALYFIYLLLDTLFLAMVEKNLKLEKSKENE